MAADRRETCAPWPRNEKHGSVSQRRRRRRCGGGDGGDETREVLFAGLAMRLRLMSRARYYICASFVLVESDTNVRFEGHLRL